MEDFVDETHGIQAAGGNAPLLLPALVKEFVQLGLEFLHRFKIRKYDVAGGSEQSLVELARIPDGAAYMEFIV
jgi:hypothetical protein